MTCIYSYIRRKRTGTYIMGKVQVPYVYKVGHVEHAQANITYVIKHGTRAGPRVGGAG
jgi:hypothetical protein